jgi:hypothetical protein
MKIVNNGFGILNYFVYNLLSIIIYRFNQIKMKTKSIKSTGKTTTKTPNRTTKVSKTTNTTKASKSTRSPKVNNTTSVSTPEVKNTNKVYTPIARNIYYNGSQYRVRVSISGVRHDRYFTTKKSALAFKKELLAGK